MERFQIPVFLLVQNKGNSFGNLCGNHFILPGSLHTCEFGFTSKYGLFCNKYEPEIRNHLQTELLDKMLCISLQESYSRNHEDEGVIIKRVCTPW